MKTTYEEPLATQVAEDTEGASTTAAQPTPAERVHTPLLTALFASTAALAEMAESLAQVVAKFKLK